MLRPQDSPTRERKNLSGLWKFKIDTHGNGRSEAWYSNPLSDAIDMPVPSSYNDVVPGRKLHEHVGEVWYQTSVWVPRAWSGERMVLRFDSATHTAEAWVGDESVATHAGGYTPFEVDITSLATAGERLRITVAVDNVLSWETIPPGIVTETEFGRRQKYMHDFFNYAGLHRPVWLYTTPKAHIEDLTLVPGVEGDPAASQPTGTLDYNAALSGVPEDHELRARLLDADGQEAATAVGPRGQLSIPQVKLWQPGAGYLYEFVAEVFDAHGILVDSYTQRVGIRTVEVRGTEFLINGKPFYFKGFGMHEDHLVRGKGQDDVSMVHDFELLKWIGANSFRTSHYPYAEEILDYADEHGIVVIDETAAVGMNATVATTLGTKIDNVFGPDAVSEVTQRAHAQAIRELFERDKNRTCVVLWSIANEPESHTEASENYFKPLFELARQLDPHRPIGFVNVQFSPAGACRLTQYSDVVMINRYYGWYTQSGDLANAEAALETELNLWAEDGKPILVTEYGADAVSGLHTLTGAMWSEEFQTEQLDMYHRVFDRVPAVQGEHVWNFADFQTSLGIVRVDGNKKGVFSRDRRPKASAHLLRKRWHGSATHASPQD